MCCVFNEETCITRLAGGNERGKRANSSASLVWDLRFTTTNIRSHFQPLSDRIEPEVRVKHKFSMFDGNQKNEWQWKNIVVKWRATTMSTRGGRKTTSEEMRYIVEFQYEKWQNPPTTKLSSFIRFVGAILHRQFSSSHPRRYVHPTRRFSDVFWRHCCVGGKFIFSLGYG